MRPLVRAAVVAAGVTVALSACGGGSIEQERIAPTCGPCCHGSPAPECQMGIDAGTSTTTDAGGMHDAG